MYSWPAAPSRIRVTKNSAKVVARPLNSEQADQTSTTSATIAVRRPLSASRPAGRSSTTPASAAAVGMAPAMVSPKPKWSWIAGSAPATRLTSTRSMNATSATTRAGHQPNGAFRFRSTATGGRLTKTSVSTVGCWLAAVSDMADSVTPKS